MGLGGAAVLAGAEALRFTEGPLAATFFTGLRGPGRDACFLAGLFTRSVAGFFGADFRAFAADVAFPAAGRAPGFFLVAFLGPDEAAGRPLPGAAFFGAGRALGRAGFALVRDLAMVRAR